MHFQFLIEDKSGSILIEKIMNKLEKENRQFTYNCKAFKGIGGFKKQKKISDIKTNKLLNDLPMFLRAFDKKFKAFEAAVIVVLDNDDRDIDEFNEELIEMAKKTGVSIDYVFCIAVEEMEAWLLGDKEALFRAYPQAKESVYKEYIQDSICGTWELLADVVFPGGIRRLKKICDSYSQIGKYKFEWANNISEFMNLNDNKSPSFRFFIDELRKRTDVTN